MSAGSHALVGFTEVTVRFGDVHVLDGVSLRVAHGEFVALVGPSGCGKTTLLNLCSGWLQPTSGTVQRPDRVRMVFQQDGLFPWFTVGENVRLGLRHVADESARARQALELLALVGLAAFERHYPHQLSGGMRQRAELARLPHIFDPQIRRINPDERLIEVEKRCTFRHKKQSLSGSNP